MFDRGDRLKELFRAEISQALREVKDPGLSGFLTITDIKLSADRKTVTAYYSILGTPKERALAARALKRCASFVRHLLRKRVTLKVLPSIVFVFDDTPQRASRVEKLLNIIERKDTP